MKSLNEVTAHIPARFRPWIASLFGGLGLVGVWTYIDRHERILPKTNAGTGVSSDVESVGSANQVPAVGNSVVSGKPNVSEGFFADDDVMSGDGEEYEDGEEGVLRRRRSGGTATGVVTPPTTPSGGMMNGASGGGMMGSGGGMMAGPYRDGSYQATSTAPWGEMKIAVTVKNGRWSNIQVLSIPDSPPSYAAVNDLVAQSLQAQTAQIAGVSGATYTSNAFRDDLSQIIVASTK